MIHTERSPLSLQFPVGKGNPRWKFRFPSISGHFLGASLVSHTMETAGKFAELDHWESACDGEDGVSTTNTHILPDPVPTYNAQTVLTSTFATCRTKRVVQRDWGIDQGIEFCLIWGLR